MSLNSYPKVLGGGAGPSNGSSTSGVFLAGNGTAAAPSFSFASQTGTGFYLFNTTNTGFSSAGALSLIFGGSGQIFNSTGNSTIQLNSAGAISLTASGTNQSITFTPSGTGRGVFQSAAGSFAVQIDTSNTNGSSALWLTTTANGNAASRNWALVTNVTVFGDVQLLQSANASGNPTTAKLVVAPTGNLLLGGLTVDDGATSLQTPGLIKTAGFARVTADVTNATATMSNLTDLSITVAAGIKYSGTIELFAVDSTGADGIKFDLGGGGATFTDLQFGFGAQPTGATLGVVTSTTSTTAITLTVVSTSDACYSVAFGFTCNAGGTFIPRFAQNAHTTGTATLRKNSSIQLTATTN